MSNETEGTEATKTESTENQTTTDGLVEVQWDGKTIQVPSASAEVIKESLNTMKSGLQTKHQEAMETEKAVSASNKARLEKDIAWYSSNPQEAWESYVPLVRDKNGGFKGDPSLLVQKTAQEDNYVETEQTTPKVQAMTPDPMLAELSELKKRQNDMELAMERRSASETLGSVDRVLPKYNLAKKSEVVSAIKDYYNRTGQHANKVTVEGFVKDSHDSTLEITRKAGTFTEKPRYEGTAPGGDLPRQKVEGIKGNPFGTQKERDVANQALADLL